MHRFTKCSASYSDTQAEGQDSCLSGEGQSGAPIWVDTSPNQAAIIGVLTSTPFNSRYVAPDGETQTRESLSSHARSATVCCPAHSMAACQTELHIPGLESQDLLPEGNTTPALPTLQSFVELRHLAMPCNAQRIPAAQFTR